MMIEYPTASHIPALKKLWALSFPDPEGFIGGFFETGFSSRRCRCILDGETAIAALYWFDAEYLGQKMAYLYGVATDPAYRGQGLCRQLMEDVHKLLRRQGYAAALLMPGEPGLRQMYEKFDYRDCCGIGEVSCSAGNPVSLWEIGWKEYAALRPGLLPENGAVQQGLDFLSTYAHFYRGEDFLLAAAKENGTLLGLELLGNADRAPGILGAFNCEKGTFRTPGRTTSTVMALPLADGTALPGYVGLTFD